jgi:dTDP-4-amino-4,6-dideoxygalactose transaminase
MRDLEKTAKSQSMETRKWWGVGCHRMPAYSHIPHTSLTETEKQSERYLGMPFHNFLTPEDWKKMQNIFVERAQNE